MSGYFDYYFSGPECLSGRVTLFESGELRIYSAPKTFQHPETVRSLSKALAQAAADWFKFEGVYARITEAGLPTMTANSLVREGILTRADLIDRLDEVLGGEIKNVGPVAIKHIRTYLLEGELEPEVRERLES